MANNLDLEEQEQLDQLKHFWKQYGNLIAWALILVLGVFAGVEPLPALAAKPGVPGGGSVRRG